jgi:serine/threonine-protein kinase
MLRSLLNQRLGRYAIKELLGRGGMAAVYRATDTVLQRDVALKVLYPQFGDDASLSERFKREAVTAAALEHPHIVPIYDVGEHDGMAYIAMKLLDGRTFQERLQEAGAIGLEELLAVLEPVAAALDYAHARGIVHRDIKPGNIFLSRDAGGLRPMLTDFGIAKQLDATGLTTTGALIGTPDYMAPEQIAGRALDARVDVYALGMVAFRALAGRRAFEGTTQDVLLGHLYGHAPLPSALNAGLPAGVDEALGRAIAADRADRHPSAGAFVTALRQVARGGAAATAVGAPLVVRPTSEAATSSATVRGPAPAPIATQPTPRATPPPQPPRVPPPPEMPPTQPGAIRGGSGAAPWLLAVALAVVVGGLATALAFAIRDQSGQPGLTPVPPLATSTDIPPTATMAPASPTEDAAVLITVTPESTIAPPTAESPTATLLPPTVEPPTATPRSPTAEPPTATLQPPTATSRPPTAEPPTATLTPTLTATLVALCPTDLLKGGFGRLYEASRAIRDALGCPLRAEQPGLASQQFFTRGTFFYWDASNLDERADHIFVFFGLNSGPYKVFSTEEVAALGPEPPPGTDPNQPVRGFGRVYFNQPQAAERLGPWTSPEIVLKEDDPGVVQYFDKGMMIWTPDYRPSGGRSIFVLYNDGTFERYDDAFAG